VPVRRDAAAFTAVFLAFPTAFLAPPFFAVLALVVRVADLAPAFALPEDALAREAAGFFFLATVVSSTVTGAAGLGVPDKRLCSTPSLCVRAARVLVSAARIALGSSGGASLDSGFIAGPLSRPTRPEFASSARCPSSFSGRAAGGRLPVLHEASK